MNKPRLLDLFCGAGGSAKGLQRVGFYVIGVDIKPQPHYCGDEFYRADAMTFPLEGYDAYWASPPCQAYVDSANKAKHPKLIEPTRKRLLKTGKPFVIENVDTAPLLSYVMLCGTMFRLKIIRHRLFEAHPPLFMSPHSCAHEGKVCAGDYAGVYGRGARGMRHGNPRAARPFRWGAIPLGKTKRQWWGECMGIEWMTCAEMQEAIPPAYSEYIGKFLLASLERK